MAAIITKEDFLVCLNGRRVKVYQRGETEPVFCSSTTEKVSADDNTNKGDKTDQATDDDNGVGKILAHGFAKSAGYFAVCDDCKQLKIWETRSWKLHSVRTVAKRCTALTFTNREDSVLVADKAGDVYQFSMSEADKPGELILGHLSMLLDVAVSSDDRFVITADRDEKIRVSHIPNGYNIHTYCLGHTDFVSRLIVLPWQENILLSGSGDGTIRAWNYAQGQLLRTCQLRTETENQNVAVSCISCSERHRLVAVLAEGIPAIWVLRIRELGGDGALDVAVVRRLDTDTPPWHAHFRGQNLWVLQPDSDRTVLSYRCCCDDGEITITPQGIQERADDNLLCIIEKDREFFKEGAEAEPFYSHLHKKTFNNMQDYFSRKQQRMEEKSAKQKLQESTTAPEAKKQKVDES